MKFVIIAAAIGAGMGFVGGFASGFITATTLHGSAPVAVEMPHEPPDAKQLVDSQGRALRFGNRVEFVSGFYEGERGTVWKESGSDVLVSMDSFGSIRDGVWCEAKETVDPSDLVLIEDQ